MTRHHARGPAENNPPRQIGRRAPQLAVDEIRAATEKQPDGSGDASHIRKRQIRNMRETRRDDAGKQNADQATVKRHAPVAESENLVGMAEIVSVAVYQHIAQTASDDDADDDAQHDGQQGILVNAHAPTLRDSPKDEPRADEPRDVGKAVPAHGDRTHRKRDRV